MSGVRSATAEAAARHVLTIAVCAEHARELRACGGESGVWVGGAVPEFCFWGHAEGSTLGKCSARVVEVVGMGHDALKAFAVKYPKPRDTIDSFPRSSHAPQTASAADVDVWHGRIISLARHLVSLVDISAYAEGLCALDDLISLCREPPAAGVAPSREEGGAPPTPSTSSDGAAPDEHGEWVIGGSGAIAPELDEPGDEDGEEWRIGGGGSLDAREGAHARCRENLEAERVRYRRALGLLVDVAKVAREVIAYVDREAE